MWKLHSVGGWTEIWGLLLFLNVVYGLPLPPSRLTHLPLLNGPGLASPGAEKVHTDCTVENLFSHN